MWRAKEGGFVTCLAARIDPGGAVTLANAGHLAPYRNGEEVDLPPRLPLGLIADATYEETRLALAFDEALTFLSDGVVEARDEKGELFGSTAHSESPGNLRRPLRKQRGTLGRRMTSRY